MYCFVTACPDILFLTYYLAIIKTDLEQMHFTQKKAVILKSRWAETVIV